MSDAPRDYLSLIDYRELVLRERSEFQDIAIVETESFGRALFLDGMIQSAASDESLYHAALIQPACAWQGAPRRVLVIGAGEGASLRELLECSSVESILANELDPRLLEIVREHLPSWHAGSFDDPRVTLHIADARELVRELSDGIFDLVICDLTDPIEDAAQWSAIDDDFVAHLLRVLTPEGVLAMQFGELHPVTADATRNRARLLRRHFAALHFVSLQIPSFNSQWGFGFAANLPRPFLSAGALSETMGLDAREQPTAVRVLPFVVDLQSDWALGVGCVDAGGAVT